MTPRCQYQLLAVGGKRLLAQSECRAGVPGGHRQIGVLSMRLGMLAAAACRGLCRSQCTRDIRLVTLAAYAMHPLRSHCNRRNMLHAIHGDCSHH